MIKMVILRLHKQKIDKDLICYDKHRVFLSLEFFEKVEMPVPNNSIGQ